MCINILSYITVLSYKNFKTKYINYHSHIKEIYYHKIITVILSHTCIYHSQLPQPFIKNKLSQPIITVNLCYNLLHNIQITTSIFYHSSVKSITGKSHSDVVLTSSKHCN